MPRPTRASRARSQAASPPDEPAPPLSVSPASMTVDLLKKALAHVNLPTDGKKAVLVARLTEFQEKSAKKHDEKEHEEEEEPPTTTTTTTAREQNAQQQKEEEPPTT